MNQAKVEAIRKAAKKLALARQVYEGLSLNNVPVDFDERVNAECAYQLARAAFNEAQAEVSRVTDASFQPDSEDK